MGLISPQAQATRVGLAGVGKFGQLHAAVLANLPGIVIGALADPDAEQLERVASRYGVTQLHHDAEALITDDSLDAIILATPDEQHVSQAKATLQRGKHLFVEKLLADVQRLETWETPNGLIITSAAGWSLALCCLEDAPLPHFIAVRPSNTELSCAIRAYLQDGGYAIKEDNASMNGDRTDSAAPLRPVLQAVLRRLGGRRLDAQGESRRLPSPRRARTSKG